MINGGAELLAASARSLADTLHGLLLPAVIFLLFALLVKGGRIVRDSRECLPETGTNLLLVAFNAFFLAPVFIVLAGWLYSSSFPVLYDGSWNDIPMTAVILIAVFIGDFVGYWRHRLEHTWMLWPSHAVHHSDTEMSWLTLMRFHPVNRLTTFLIDNGVLLLCGVPYHALVAGNLVRHYYGYFIHADLPWTYGRLGRVFVSPAMHRWHHAADPAAYNTNFATVFSLFDRWFGTYRVPGVCRAELGVTDGMGTGVLGQLAHPLRPGSYRRLPGPAGA